MRNLYYEKLQNESDGKRDFELLHDFACWCEEKGINWEYTAATPYEITSMYLN